MQGPSPDYSLALAEGHDPLRKTRRTALLARLRASARPPHGGKACAGFSGVSCPLADVQVNNPG
jgi:hypothetical protein